MDGGVGGHTSRGEAIGRSSETIQAGVEEGCGSRGGGGEGGAEKGEEEKED